MKFYLFLLFLFSPVILHAQGGDFSFGDISSAELYMKRYDKDTTADAVVLKEFGKTYIDNSQKNILVHFYHVRIKILNSHGVDKANFVIPVHQSPEGEEEVTDIKGSTFNPGAAGSRLKQKNIFRENKTRYTDLIKFTLPNVKSGSVVEVEYTISSPFIYNFREWNFQSDIPKIYSEYWARIPANLDYNISMIGYYKLTENDRSLVKDCLTTFNGGKADCTLLKLGMKDVPAFKEEKYMTAKSNFLSSVHFELSEIHRFNGSIEKVAKTWGDVDRELQTHKDFGVQLKRGEIFFSKITDTLTAGVNDEVAKAKRIYAFIQKWYKWNGYTGIFCESGIKRAFDNHGGNIGDINLSLVAALRAAGLDASSVLISTRDNGVPHDLFPVVSDFNYVLVRLNTPGAVYLLDASRLFLPFGMFPMDCINGRGRVMYENKPSEWMSVTAPAILKAMNMANLTLDSEGNITGTIVRNYEGYLALSKRQEIRGFNSTDDYIEELQSHWNEVKILGDSISNLDDPDKPLTEEIKIVLKGSNEGSADQVVFNPFFQRFIRDNPFRSAERHFPVDFGAPEELYTVLMLKYPSGYHMISSPEKAVITLPEKDAKYILDKSEFSHTLILKTVIQQTKAIYKADEYDALKELYNRIIQSQRADVILSKSS